MNNQFIIIGVSGNHYLMKASYETTECALNRIKEKGYCYAQYNGKARIVRYEAIESIEYK